MKRVTGDPMGGGKIVDHHNFIFDVYRGVLQHRLEKFVAKLTRADVTVEETADPFEALLRIQTMFHDFCDGFECSKNEFSRSGAMFIKKWRPLCAQRMVLERVTSCCWSKNAVIGWECGSVLEKRRTCEQACAASRSCTTKCTHHGCFKQCEKIACQRWTVGKERE